MSDDPKCKYTDSKLWTYAKAFYFISSKLTNSYFETVFSQTPMKKYKALMRAQKSCQQKKSFPKRWNKEHLGLFIS